MDKNEKNGPSLNLDPNKTPVLYADSVYIKSDNHGVVLDFAQQIGPSNQYSVVARIGISKDHAQDLIEHLEGLLKAEGNSSTKKTN